MTPRRRTSAEHFHEHSLNTKRTGDILREAREARGESLKQLSEAIKIRPSMLESIEAGHFYGLTDPLYLKGFIRAYAVHVGLQEDEVMPFFRREYDEQEHQQQEIKQPLTPIEPKKPRVTPAWVLIGFLAAAIVALVGYSYHQYVTLALTPTLNIDSPKDGQTSKQPQIAVSGRTDPDVTLTLNGQAVQLDPDGRFHLTVGLAIGANTLQFRAVNKLGKEAQQQRVVMAEGTLAQAPAAPTPTVLSASSSAETSSSAKLSQSSMEAVPSPTVKPSAAPTPAGVHIEVSVGPSSAWLEVTADGKNVFTGMLLPGASQTFSGNQTIHVKTGNGGSTRVSKDGVDQGLLGGDAQVVERDYGP